MEEASNGDIETEATDRIVIANGQYLDKQYFHEARKTMARDWDLRKIAWLGPPLWVVLSGISLIYIGMQLRNGVTGASLIGTFDTISERTAQTDLSVLYGLVLDNAHWFVLLPVVVWLLVTGLPIFLKKAIAAVITSIFKIGRGFVRASRSVNPETWQKSNYWNPFMSHLSDRDPLVVLNHGSDQSISGTFSDSPYYGNVLVDSVYVEIEGDLGYRQRLFTYLYDHRVRWGWRILLGLSALIVGMWTIDPFLEIPTTPMGETVPWSRLVFGAVFLWVILGSAMWITRYPQFLVGFLGESAGLSRYKRLLNEPDAEDSERSDGRIGLSNSLCGYGLFFVSEFLYQIFGYQRYNVSLEAELLPEQPNREVRADGTGQKTEKSQRTSTDTSDENGDPSFRPEAYEHPTSEHAVAAGRELLWSAVPRESVREGGENEDITLSLSGVDYYTVTERKRSLLARLLNRLEGRKRDDENGTVAPSDESSESEPESEGRSETEEIFVKERAGRASGIRLPVKKFMSVPHELSPETVRNPPKPVPEVYQFDDAEGTELAWNEDTRHYVLLGGGEHQQAINKLILGMKAAGYENVDVLENAFASTQPTEELSISTALDNKDLSQFWKSLTEWWEPGLPLEKNAIEEPAFFPTEYFVSGVFGGTEFFRSDDDTFLLFSHEAPSDDTDTEIFFHVIIGFSAVATKIGFLYWLDQYDDGFPDVSLDTGYLIRHPGATAIDGLEDIGHLYANPRPWRTGDVSLEFDRQPLSSNERTQNGVETTSPDGSGGDQTEQNNNRRGLSFKDCNLEINYDPSGS
ncbi:hypothetical protein CHINAEXTREME_17800 [Halobiforma lacisalsi AJ5]|uniref:Uncharacterized protein n=1 Tax=Natronobacterium lacisalsi AJ5 TaxID=358396 RepID=M0LGT6_NATLA|nr:hypothetical protein [Halobiforma lacisalsi]APW99506.1 hypothetical protein CHINAEXTREME_17800 [Halobiforma lacisalsi AJ5]EMA31629.1 hypothetical protein C445_14142 [Halobiforma lacisalsi AJ5]